MNVSIGAKPLSYSIQLQNIPEKELPFPKDIIRMLQSKVQVQ
jgi:hypothetical protein